MRSRLFDAIVPYCPTAACKRKNSKALALTGAALFSTAPLNFQRPHSSPSAKEDAFFCALELTRAIYYRERTPFSSRWYSRPLVKVRSFHHGETKSRQDLRLRHPALKVHFPTLRIGKLMLFVSNQALADAANNKRTTESKDRLRRPIGT